MQAYQTSSPGDASLARDLLRVGRYYLGGRRGLLILGGTIVVAGLVSSWSWLAAVGVAPLLLSVLPCVAMCALGLCMNKMAGGSCAKDAAPDNVASTPLVGDPKQLTLNLADTIAMSSDRSGGCGSHRPHVATAATDATFPRPDETAQTIAISASQSQPHG